MDIDSVLVSVQERDKWRRRLELLQASLADVKERQGRLEARLKRVKRDLGKLSDYSDAVLSRNPGHTESRSASATSDTRIPAR